MKTRQLILTASIILISELTVQASALKIYFGNDFCTSTTKVIFSANASTGFDSKLDKEIKKLPGNRMNYIYSLAGDKHMLNENYYPETGNYSAIPLQIAVKEQGTFTFDLEDMNNDLDNMQYVLSDLSTGETSAIHPGFSKKITFTAEDINTKRNYLLHIFHTPVINSSPVSCNESLDGIISVSFADTGKWEAKISTSGSIATAHVDGKNRTARFGGLEKGIYYLEIWKGNVKIYESITSVGHPAKLKPRFSASADTINAGEKLFAENLSGTGERWYWDFGDNSASNQFQPSHIYKAPGIYKLTLTTSNEAGCTSSVSQLIYVQPLNENLPVVQKLMTN